MRIGPSLTFVLFVTLLTLASTHPTSAEHGSPLLLVKPGDGARIPRNAHTRLVSYNGEDGLIYWLGRSPGKVRVWLESERHTARLRPVRYLTDHDGYGRAMVTLAARGLLRPETEYRLKVDVPSEGWSEELATFTTTDVEDHDAPRWAVPPSYAREEHTFHGRLTTYDGLLEVGITAWPHGGGRARRTFVLFDLDQKCIDGPTADYNVAIYNSQCIDAEERALKNAICDTLYYFQNWRPEGTAFDITIDVRDMAGNLRRVSRLPTRLDLDDPIGFCLAM